MSDADKSVKANEPNPVDARVVITVSRDHLTAEACFSPPENGGKDIDLQLVLNEIANFGIHFGLEKSVIEEKIRNKAYGVKFIVARGVPPQNGTDASFEYMFDRKKNGLPKVLEDGSVDFHNLDRMTTVKEREVLLKLIPHTEGKPGTTVFNKPISQKRGKPRYIVPGKNTLLLPDGKTLVAEIDGEVKEYNGKVSVSNCIDIETDVGSETGDINFSGNIRIHGGVNTGYRVVSTNGNVEVSGVVEGAYIEAEGNVVLKSGMKGGEKGQIVARGDIASRFLESCKVYATGNIHCDVVMNSDVACRGVLDVSSGKGLIVGKTVRAGTEIIGKIIGSRNAVPTKLEVGIDPESLDRYKKAQKELEEQNEMLEKLNKSMDYLVKLKIAGKLTLEQMSTMGSILKSIKAVKEKIYDLTEELASLSSLVDDIGRGRIRVKDIIYHGVALVIGRSAYIVKGEQQYCSFIRDGADIKLSPY